jgi:hypothetical protein
MTNNEILQQNLAANNQLSFLPHSVKDIENGESFFLNIKRTFTLSGGVKRLSFRTNGQKTVYFLGVVLSSLAGQIDGELWEGAQGGAAADGDVLTCLNKNRRKADVCDITIKENSTTVDEVILMSPFVAGVGSSPGKAETGQATVDPDPTILKKNTNYTLKLTPTIDTVYFLNLRWNERKI